MRRVRVTRSGSELPEVVYVARLTRNDAFQYAAGVWDGSRFNLTDSYGEDYTNTRYATAGASIMIGFSNGQIAFADAGSANAALAHLGLREVT